MINIQTQLSRKDHGDLIATIIKRKASFKFLRGLGWVIITVGLLTLVISVLDRSFDPTTFGLLAIGGCFTFGFPTLVRYSSKKTFDSSKALSAPVSYQLSPEKIIATSEFYESNISWDLVREVTEDPKWFLIWENANTARGLPKRDFTEAQIQEFKAMLESIPDLSFKGLKN